MLFHTIRPSTLVLRSEDEKVRLEKILQKFGLTLSPVSKAEAIDLWESESEPDDTQPYDSDPELPTEKLPYDLHSKGTHSLARPGGC